jgi:hypothetical protein
VFMESVLSCYDRNRLDTDAKMAPKMSCRASSMVRPNRSMVTDWH